eukprot:781382-Amphidinium_carterae.1
MPAISRNEGYFGMPYCVYSAPSNGTAFLFSGPLKAFSYFSCALHNSSPIALSAALKPKSSECVAKVLGK